MSFILLLTPCILVDIKEFLVIKLLWNANSLEILGSKIVDTVLIIPAFAPKPPPLNAGTAVVIEVACVCEIKLEEGYCKVIISPVNWTPVDEPDWYDKLDKLDKKGDRNSLFEKSTAHL